MFFSKDGLQSAKLIDYSEIGGWLIIVVIYTAINTIASLVILISTIASLISQGIIISMFTASFKIGNELIPVYYSMVIILYLLLFVFALVTVIMLLKRKRNSKILAMILYLSNVIIAGVIYSVSRNIEIFKNDPSYSSTSFTQSILPAVVWVIYLLRSERVRNTLTK